MSRRSDNKDSWEWRCASESFARLKSFFVAALSFDPSCRLRAQLSSLLPNSRCWPDTSVELHFGPPCGNIFAFSHVSALCHAQVKTMDCFLPDRPFLRCSDTDSMFLWMITKIIEVGQDASPGDDSISEICCILELRCPSCRLRAQLSSLLPNSKVLAGHFCGIAFRTSLWKYFCI